MSRDASAFVTSRAPGRTDAVAGSPAATTTLGDLAVGAEAIVVDVDGPRAVVRRLLEMGLTPKTRVRVVRRAPLGDPMEIELRGYLLTLRRDEARLVSVRDAT